MLITLRNCRPVRRQVAEPTDLALVQLSFQRLLVSGRWLLIFEEGVGFRYPFKQASNLLSKLTSLIDSLSDLTTMNGSQALTSYKMPKIAEVPSNIGGISSSFEKTSDLFGELTNQHWQDTSHVFLKNSWIVIETSSSLKKPSNLHGCLTNQHPQRCQNFLENT